MKLLCRLYHYCIPHFTTVTFTFMDTQGTVYARARYRCLVLFGTYYTRVPFPPKR